MVCRAGRRGPVLPNEAIRLCLKTHPVETADGYLGWPANRAKEGRLRCSSPPSQVSISSLRAIGFEAKPHEPTRFLKTPRLLACFCPPTQRARKTPKRSRGF